MATGHKIPLILVHGLGVSGDYYLPLAKAMQPFYDIYIIDLPGYGTTPKPYPPLSIKELSNVLLDYVAKKNLHDTVVVGQSMGCQIIAHAAAQDPTPFTKMILIGPTVNKDERHFLVQSLRLLQDTLREPPSATLLVMRDYIRMGIRRYLLTTKDMIADHIETTLAHCHLPVLIVRGKNDPIVPRSWVTYLTQDRSNRTPAEVPNAPHLLHYKKPQELVDICRRFIES